jgi:hypothetical protein
MVLVFSPRLILSYEGEVSEHRGVAREERYCILPDTIDINRA